MRNLAIKAIYFILEETTNYNSQDIALLFSKNFSKIWYQLIDEDFFDHLLPSWKVWKKHELKMAHKEKYAKLGIPAPHHVPGISKS